VNECRHFYVAGRVQGVFYRSSTEAKARELTLTGWVRNLADGRVELVACGPSEKLAALEKWLWIGPAHAQVTDVIVRPIDVQRFGDFSVR
jgi:acylphosphatase